MAPAPPEILPAAIHSPKKYPAIRRCRNHKKPLRTRSFPANICFYAPRQKSSWHSAPLPLPHSQNSIPVEFPRPKEAQASQRPVLSHAPIPQYFQDARDPICFRVRGPSRIGSATSGKSGVKNPKGVVPSRLWLVLESAAFLYREAYGSLQAPARFGLQLPPHLCATNPIVRQWQALP